MYIHRVGRTARYKSGGKSLLLLTPQEDKKGYIQYLQGKQASKLPLNRLSINPEKTVVVTKRAASMVASNFNLHRLAKKAYQSYVRSIYLMPNKDIFDAKDLPLEAFGESLGLEEIPNTTRFLKALAQDRSEYREGKNKNKKLQKLKDQIKAEKLNKKLQKLGKNAAPEGGNESDSDDDVLVKMDRNWHDDNDEEPLPEVAIDKVTQSRHLKKIRIEGSNTKSKHIIFNDDGEEEDIGAFLKQNPEDVAKAISKEQEGLKEANEEFMDKVKKRLERTAETDRASEKDRIRQKHKKRRLLEKGDKDEDDAEDGPVVMLGNSGDEQESGDAASSSSSDSDDSDSDNDDDEVDLKAQEDIALSLIRGS